MANKKIHVFWSGGEPAKEAAQKYCNDNDCVMLGMTHIAVYKDTVLKKERKRLLKQGWSPRSIWFQNELPEWEKMSLEFAKSSPYENVHVFIDVTYREPEDMKKEGSEYREKPWLNDFYYGWSDEDYQKFRNLFPNGQIPKRLKECNYDRKKSVLHRIEHPILKQMNKHLIIHYVK